MSSPPAVAVVGPGAIGTTVAAALHEAGRTPLLCGRTARDMGTSILADREAGRPLEWDTRNGVIARRGRAHGIPTPVSDVVVPLLAAGSAGPG